MIRVAKVFQIGLEPLVMGIIVIADAIFQSDVIDYGIELIQKIGRYVLVIVNRKRRRDKNRRDVPFLAQGDQIDQILLLILFKIFFLIFKMPLISCKSLGLKFLNGFSAVDFFGSARLGRIGYSRIRYSCIRHSCVRLRRTLLSRTGGRRSGGNCGSHIRLRRIYDIFSVLREGRKDYGRPEQLKKLIPRRKDRETHCDKILVQAVVRIVLRGQKAVITDADGFLILRVRRLLVEGEVGDGNEEDAALCKIILVHINQGVIIQEGLAGEGEIEGLIAALLRQGIPVEGALSVGASHVGELDIFRYEIENVDLRHAGAHLLFVHHVQIEQAAECDAYGKDTFDDK